MFKGGDPSQLCGPHTPFWDAVDFLKKITRPTPWMLQFHPPIPVCLKDFGVSFYFLLCEYTRELNPAQPALDLYTRTEFDQQSLHQ